MLTSGVRGYSLRTMFINFGPQHPAAHGVLRLILELSGEIVISVSVNIGLLHRGTEKLLEVKTVTQGLPYFDRLDYVSVLSQEHAFCLAVESLTGQQISYRVSLIRVIGEELTRILNHLMGITTHALDIGAMTPFLWGFEEREKIMVLCEMLSGARLHMGFFRPGGLSRDIPRFFLKNTYIFILKFRSRIEELESLLLANRIWKTRLLSVGFLAYYSAMDYSASGPMLRGSGGLQDLRKSRPYEVYSRNTFEVPIGRSGDSYDRFLLRVEELKQSAIIIMQSLNMLNFCSMEPFGEKGSMHLGVSGAELTKGFRNITMEDIISKFRTLLHPVLERNQGIRYVSIEAPKGELGVGISLDGRCRPTRCRITSPAFKHLQLLELMARGTYLSDVITVVGTQDLVFGEVDR